MTVWKVVSGGWWSAKRIDVGTVEASGSLDLKQYKDGTTNLQRLRAEGGEERRGKERHQEGCGKAGERE